MLCTLSLALASLARDAAWQKGKVGSHCVGHDPITLMACATGCSKIVTPNLAKLAAKSLFLNKNYVQQVTGRGPC